MASPQGPEEFRHAQQVYHMASTSGPEEDFTGPAVVAGWPLHAAAQIARVPLPIDHPLHDVSHRTYRSQRSTLTVDGFVEPATRVEPGSSHSINSHGRQHSGLSAKDESSIRGSHMAAAAGMGGGHAVVMLPLSQTSTPGTPTLRSWLITYAHKWSGGVDTPMPPEPVSELLLSWVGSFSAIAACALLNQYLTPTVSLPLLVASFGASAVLVFGVPNSKLASPRCLVGGHILSAVTGVCVRLVVRDVPWLSAALGMSLSLTVMQLTRTTHPPGGASALIAASTTVIGDWAGFKFVLTVLFGSLIMLVIGLVLNNISTRRRYPTYWF